METAIDLGALKDYWRNSLLLEAIGNLSSLESYLKDFAAENFSASKSKYGFIAPYEITFQNQQFYPIFYQVKIENNSIVVAPNLSTPFIIPKFLEPFGTEKFVLGDYSNYLEFYGLSAQALSSAKSVNDLNQLCYKLLTNFKNHNCQINPINKIITEEDLIKISPNIENFSNLQLTDTYLKLLDADNVCADSKYLEEFQGKNFDFGSVLGSLSSSYTTGSEACYYVNKLCALPKDGKQAIEASFGTQSKQLALNYIATNVVRSALHKQTKLPTLAIMVDSDVQLQELHNLIDQLHNEDSLTQSWLPNFTSRVQTFTNNFNALNLKIDYTNAKDFFLATCNKYFTKDFTTLTEACAFIHDKLQSLAKDVQNGFKLIKAVYNVSKELDKEYERFGGFEERFNSLQQQKVQAKKDVNRWLQITQAWEEYLEETKSIFNKLEFLPFFRGRRIKRDKKFIESNFDQKINIKSHKGLHLRIYANYNQAKREFNAKANALSHIETDWQRINEAMNNFSSWVNTNNLDKEFAKINIQHITANRNNCVDDFMRLAEEGIFWQLYGLALHYFEANYLQTQGQNVKLNTIMPFNLVTQQLVLNSEYTKRFDSLTVLNAQNKSASMLPVLQAVASKVITLADIRSYSVKIVPATVDLKLVEYFQLTEDAVDGFDDLDYAKVLTSRNSLHEIVAKFSYYQIKYNYGFDCFSLNVDTLHTPKIVTMLNEIYHHDLIAYRGSATQRLENYNKSNDARDNEFSLDEVTVIPIPATTKTRTVVKTNTNEAKAIVNWLELSADFILSKYPNKKLTDLVCVLAPHRAQVDLIRQELDNSQKIDFTNVETIFNQQRHYPVIILSAVYSHNMQRPFVYDLEYNLLEKTLMLSEDHLVIFSDSKLWQQGNNTNCRAIGKYANYITETNNTFENEKILEQ